MDKIFVVVENNTSINHEDDIKIIKAKTPKDAMVVYSEEYYAKDKYFRMGIEDRCINSAFWENFFFDDIFKFINGDFVTKLSDDEIDSKLEENIRKFFNGNEFFVAELLGFYNDRNKTCDDLSQDIINEISLNEVMEGYARGCYIVKEVKA